MKKSNSPYEVLLLEDEPSLQEAIRIKLNASGLVPSLFDDGKKALDAIKARGKHFDGVWLDFDVLEINGVEFMKQFITIPGWEHSPVLIVSNTGNPSLIQQAIDLGAKEWIIKAEVRLDDTVDKFISIIETAQKG